MSVEVFKTNVENPEEADRIIARIQEGFHDYTVNFDLEDRDRVLRIVSANGQIETTRLLNLLNVEGIMADPLPD